MSPPTTSLSTVPEDTDAPSSDSQRSSLVSVTEWRRAPPSHLAASASDPNLPHRGRPPSSRTPPSGHRTPPNGYRTPPNGMRTPPNGMRTPPNGSHRGLPRPPRPVSFPPPRSASKSPLATEYYSPPPSIHAGSEFEFFAPIRGATNLRASEQFYAPPAPGTVTVASSLSEDLDDDGRIPWYRRPAVIAGYVIALFVIIGVAVALGVVL
ncbi:hypothetical protein EDC01DRAFT_384083 [Geopyxis carbonaria]|nr:hypothetical protein EDC01DRAFT_384083 [Geopyxis carbonaria]